MAIIINGLLRGRLGNEVYYIRNGRNYTRPVRRVTKHSDAQLARQRQFAKAANICKTLHKEITGCFAQAPGHRIYTRLMSCMLHLVKGQDKNIVSKGNCGAWFTNCKFSDGPSVKERWQVNFKLVHAEDGLVQLHIPAFSIPVYLRAPLHTCEVTCKILLTGCSLADGASTGSCTAAIKIDYTETNIAEQVIDLPVATPAGSLVILCMALEYRLFGRGVETINSNPAYQPCGVVDALLV